MTNESGEIDVTHDEEPGRDGKPCGARVDRLRDDDRPS